MDGRNTFLGIELGSTRIKAVLTDDRHRPLLTADFTWESQWREGVWSYDMDTVWEGLRAVFGRIADQYAVRYGAALTHPGGMGISAMMHGYLPFDARGRLLTPFRTWRNTTTGGAAESLTRAFGFNIPQRWTVAHLYHAVSEKEPHVQAIDYLTTLAGYVHWQLTGERVIGIGDAAGIFPVDSDTGTYDAGMAERFREMTGLRVEELLPSVRRAGQPAGALTRAGAARLDPTGKLAAGVPLCPPEGDAGTGMVATRAVAPRTGNVSAGTSVFAMVVLDKPLRSVHPAVDIVATPDGRPVAMVHCNNGTSDIDAWMRLFDGVMKECGVAVDRDALYERLFDAACRADDDCGGLVSCNYYAGEPVTGFARGRPLLVRTPDSRLTAANLMGSLLHASLASLAMGMEALTAGENIRVERMAAHGGLFKTGTAGQRLLAAALDVPVSVARTAGEGGAWGIAVLAAYMRQAAPGEGLDDYLTRAVFTHDETVCVAPDGRDRARFLTYLKRYRAGLAVERAAVEHL